jgi:copper(I)-binding protein
MLISLANTFAFAGTPAETPPIRVADAWIRWLPAGLPAGGYATLTNTGEKPLDLIAASSSAYAEVSIHRSIDQGGTISMEPVQRITIHSHSTVDFAAQGYHLMLMQAKQPVKPGDRVPMTLRFSDGLQLTVPFEVRK